MNHDTLQYALPELTADFLRSDSCLVDKLFAELWKQVGMKALLKRCGFHKRSGIDLIHHRVVPPFLFQHAYPSLALIAGKVLQYSGDR